MNDYPSEYDVEFALEIVESGYPVAWTEDDNVYVRQPEKSDREDGYVLIGQLEWNDNSDSYAESEYDNLQRLRAFVREQLKLNQA